jgi:UDP-N-acetylmuramoyl-tripeptide--D-alanyl-D-alanine ligase
MNDTYNANPASMEAALKTLAEIETKGKKIAILGDMLELGGQSRASHLQLGKQVTQYGIDRLYLLGRQARYVRQGALSLGMKKSRVIIGIDHTEIGRLLREEARDGDWLLFKGSRATAMEKALAAFKRTGI